MGDCVKVGDIHCPFLIREASHITAENNWVGHAWFAFFKSMQAVSKYLFCPSYAGKFSMRICSLISQETKIYRDCSMASQILLPFFKGGCHSLWSFKGDKEEPQHRSCLVALIWACGLL